MNLRANVTNVTAATGNDIQRQEHENRGDARSDKNDGCDNDRHSNANAVATQRTSSFTQAAVSGGISNVSDSKIRDCWGFVNIGVRGC